MITRSRALLGAVAVLLLVGVASVAYWAGTSANTSANKSANKQRPTNPPPPAPLQAPQQQPKGDPGNLSLEEGGKARWDNGDTLVLYSFEFPAQPTAGYYKAPPGTQVAAADVEFCAGSSATETWQVNPARFDLQMKDNSRISETAGPMKPSLDLVELLPGDCTRGYLGYEVPQGQTPKTIIYANSAGQPAARWNVK